MLLKQLAHRFVCRYLGISWNLLPLAGSVQTSRRFAALSADQVQAAMDKINDMFVEAREEISYAQEDAGTTYFNESYDDAKQLVDAVLTEWNGLLRHLEAEEKGKVQRSMGLKMEQLKAELQQLDTLHD